MFLCVFFIRHKRRKSLGRKERKKSRPLNVAKEKVKIHKHTKKIRNGSNTKNDKSNVDIAAEWIREWIKELN